MKGMWAIHRHGTLAVLCLAVLVAAALVLAPKLRSTNARAQSAGSGDLLAQLAERLLGTTSPVTPFPAGLPVPQQSQPSAVQLLPGALPSDSPLALPLPPNSTLIGSAERASYPRGNTVIIQPGGIAPSPTPASSGKHVDIVIDASGTPADITSFYTDAMAKLGWSPPSPATSGFPPGSGGFLSSTVSSSPSTTFCQSADGPWLSVTVLPATSGPQDVRLALDTGNPGPCSLPTPFVGPGPVPMLPPGLGLLPRLAAPSGIYVQAVGGGGGGPGRFGSDAVATTDLSPSDVEAFYEQELVTAGWQRTDGGSASSLAWSIWSIPDQSDWQGFLYVRPGPGDGKRSLHAEVASPSEQTSYGPAFGYALSPAGGVYPVSPVAAASATASASTTSTPAATPTQGH